ncbi:hypothetical protein VTO42DRAFT_2476 [Malbranchea cinnamomea]
MTLLAFCVASAVWLWMKEVIRRGRTFEWESEKLRGKTATANLIPESVEWINTLLETLWGLLNPDMFASVADTLEDVMQASVPSVIENVRVAELDQGTNPFRLLSLRALPSSEAQDLEKAMRKYHQETKSDQEAAAIEEGGGHYNLECSFAYHAKPALTSSQKAANMHMLLVMYLGVKGLFGVPLPIFVELIEFVATIRLRIQFAPQPPFAKNVTFSLMGLPHVRAGCTPMFRTGVNILNLPLISNFVNYAIGAAASLYVAPKSMSIDLDMLLQGDDILKDTLAMGVLWIRIHRAIGLSKQDKRGSVGGGSDPYINISFSKYGKPMYCTRVICDDLNPVWEESCALLVTPELIKADEQLSVELWDSDRNTADDIVGKIEVSMQKMIQHPGRMYPMTSSLQGLHVGTEMPGKLHWEVGYFAKPRMRPALRTDGKDPNLPDTLKGDKKLQDEKGYILNDDQDAVVHTPPDPLWPSGICSIIIHQIVNLQVASNKGTLRNRKNNEYAPAMPYGENVEEEGQDLPTSYCTILLNDTIVYRTRAKAVSSKPIFNAGTERFVRDWRSAIITITVRDQRYREHDPILGVVPLKLSDILLTSSQVTRWYPLDGGIGYGRIRVSLLFRSVETKLPPTLLGWEVGTFEIVSDRITVKNYRHHHMSLKMRSGGAKVSLPRTSCRPLEERDGAYFDLSTEEVKHRLCLPLKHRFRSAIIFQLKEGGKAYAVLWLQHLIDNEEKTIDLPIWTTKNVLRLTQNYITEDNLDEKREPGLEDVKTVGRLQFSCRFSPGLDEAHESIIDDNLSRETYETWEECVAEGVRSRRVTKDLPDTVRELHQKSLIQVRDVIRQAKPEDRQQILEKDNGIDWAKIFGDVEGAPTPGRQEPARQGQVAPEEISPRQDTFSTDSGVFFDQGAPENHVSGKAKEGSSGEGPPTTHGAIADSTGDEQRPSGEERNKEGEIEGEGNESLLTAEGGQEYETIEEHQKRLGDRANKRSEHRKQRGIMQWKPARNAAFAKDEAAFVLKKVRRRFTGDLAGREPDIETETSP